MITPWEKANKIAEKFEGKSAKIVAFWGSLTAFIAIVPAIISVIVWIWTFGTHLYNLDRYVTNFTEVSEYLVFQVGQNTRRIDAEHDLKTSFGVPVRMSNPPKGFTQGDLWYTTYAKIGDKWYIVTYKAQPNLSEGWVDIFDYHNDWGKAGAEPKPTKKDIKAN